MPALGGLPPSLGRGQPLPARGSWQKTLKNMASTGSFCRPRVGPGPGSLLQPGPLRSGQSPVPRPRIQNRLKPLHRPAALKQITDRSFEVDVLKVELVCSGLHRRRSREEAALGPACGRPGLRQPAHPPLPAPCMQSELPVLVECWASWCGPCKLVGPNIERVAAVRAACWAGRLLLRTVGRRAACRRLAARRARQPASRRGS